MLSIMKLNINICNCLSYQLALFIGDRDCNLRILTSSKASWDFAHSGCLVSVVSENRIPKRNKCVLSDVGAHLRR